MNTDPSVAQVILETQYYVIHVPFQTRALHSTNANAPKEWKCIPGRREILHGACLFSYFIHSAKSVNTLDFQCTIAKVEFSWRRDSSLEGRRSTSSTGRFILGERTRYHQDRRMGGPQSRSASRDKPLDPAGNRAPKSRARRYSDCANPPLQMQMVYRCVHLIIASLRRNRSQCRSPSGDPETGWRNIIT
jgi:hypothetical protein